MERNMHASRLTTRRPDEGSPMMHEPRRTSLPRTQPFDVAVIGGGILGLATAVALLQRRRRALIVLEAEERVAAHQTGHNSGVIHAGLYYRPGSLKARLCVAGREALYRFCRDRGVRHERCGKLVVATRPSDLPILRQLAERGHANRVGSLQWCSAEQIREFEPHAHGLAAIHVADTGIVDFAEVAAALAERVVELGGTVQTGASVVRVVAGQDGFLLQTPHSEVPTLNLVNCAGLQSDRIARLCGIDPELRIVPFRGEYFRLRPDRRCLVRTLIYPVPDPALPFLGVHLTRTIRGEVEAGPNAVLALSRHGYRWNQVLFSDLVDTISYRGFWRMAKRHWQTGLTEIYRSVDRRAAARAVQRLVPDLGAGDLVPAGAGVRAQAVGADGALVDDFRVIAARGMLHVLNAPSPAATAALAIGTRLSEMAVDAFQSRRPIVAVP
jgi:L-2-hydroxyglutarate oxidase